MRRRYLLTQLATHCSLGLVLVVALFALACADSDGDGEGDPDAGDDAATGRDVRDERATGSDASTADTGVADTGTDTAQPDTTPQPDTSQPDTSSVDCGDLNEECCAGNTCNGGLICLRDLCAPTSQCPGTPACLEPAGTGASATIVMRSGTPPQLGGGPVYSDVFDLTQVELYTDDTFETSMVTSVDVTSNPASPSFGAIEVQGADWGFSAYLDLYISITLWEILPFDQQFAQGLYGGGCYTISGTEMVSDLTACGGYWPEGTEPPDSLNYETTATGVKLLFVLPKEMIWASAGDYAEYAEMAITGDLPIVFTFESAD